MVLILWRTFERHRNDHIDRLVELLGRSNRTDGLFDRAHRLDAQGLDAALKMAANCSR
jgi:hypothetical protein